MAKPLPFPDNSFDMIFHPVSNRYIEDILPLCDLTREQIQAKQENGMPLAFSHTLTEQLGGLMKEGFMLTDMFEDCDGGGLFDQYMNSYVAVRAVRLDGTAGRDQQGAEFQQGCRIK